VVEPKLGDFGIAALRELADTDAYTLMVGSVNTNSIAPVVFRKKMPFDYGARIVPVSRITDFPSVFVIRTSVPANTVQAFVEYARAAWGKVRNGTDWIGSYADIDAVILGKAAGIAVENVERPAGGADGLLAALLDAEIDMIFLNARTAGMAIEAGKIKALAVTGPTRLAGLPGVPTMAESGFAGIGTSHWHGLFASSRVPAEVVRLLHASVVRALDSDEARAAFGKAGARLVPSASPEQFGAEIKMEMAQWERVTAESRLGVE
jgi:tripartite-type tricarboxylate transporter receptor subunit TctC